MTVVHPERKVLENPTGRGRVFKGKKMLAEVAYELEVLKGLSEGDPGKPVVTGKIRRPDNARIMWGTELLTLYLEDDRKLDFICVNFDPECYIASDNGFYL
jgi:hypothetical protein